MRQSALPSNHHWAWSMVFDITSRFMYMREDFEAEALLALVKAEAHPQCPADPEEFQAFAHPFVRASACALARRTRTHDKHVQFRAEGLDDLLAPPSANNDWRELREAMSRQLPGDERLVFETVYQPHEVRAISDAAALLGHTRSKTSRLHANAMARLRSKGAALPWKNSTRQREAQFGVPLSAA